MGQDFFGNTRTGIGDFDAHLFGFGKKNRLNVQFALPVHGLSGVQKDVHKQVIELLDVAEDHG